jgi:hypothetical protein
MKCLPVFIFLERKLIFDILGSKFRFWALKPYFSLLTPKSIFFLPHVKFPIDMSHDHIGYGPQIPFLGSEGLFLPF